MLNYAFQHIGFYGFQALWQSRGNSLVAGIQILLLVIGFRMEQPGLWKFILPLIALIGLCAWMGAIRRRRVIIGTPASRVASAAQGYVGLSGTGRPLDESPLRSHLTRLPCLWYRWQTKERGHDNKWHVIDSGESDCSFILDDGSGRCVVDVEGAEILTRHTESWHSGRQRHTEWKFLEKDTIHALGEFRTLGGATQEFNAREDLNELLDAWKKNRRELLERFDLDRDGELSEQEWNLARQAARREVARMHREARDDPDVHTLSRPRDGRHYLLSNIDPRSLSRRCLLWAIFHLAFFLGALGAIPWALEAANSPPPRGLPKLGEGIPASMCAAGSAGILPASIFLPMNTV